VVQFQSTDDGMPEALLPVPEDVHVLGAPQDAEDITAGRQLPDQVRQLAVVRIPDRLHPQRTHDGPASSDARFQAHAD
jgi:hypothetical protein